MPRRTPSEATRSLPILAAALALALGACGDEPESPEPPRVSVCEAASGDALGQVKLTGKATRVATLTGLTTSDLGFVLSDGGCSIFVAGPGREAVQVQSGRTIEVDGLIDELEDQEATRLRRILDRPATASAISEGVAGTLRIDTGARFIDAFSLTTEAAE